MFKKDDLDDKLTTNFNIFLLSVDFTRRLTEQYMALTNALKTRETESLEAVLKNKSPRAVVAGFAHEVQCLQLLQKFRVSAPSDVPQTLTEAVNKLFDETMKIGFWINNPTKASTLWNKAKPYAKGPSDGTIVSLQGHLQSS
jgi:hypothetical protein